MKKKILIITLVLALIGGSALFTTNSELFQGFSGKKNSFNLKEKPKQKNKDQQKQDKDENYKKTDNKKTGANTCKRQELNGESCYTCWDYDGNLFSQDCDPIEQEPEPEPECIPEITNFELESSFYLVDGRNYIWMDERAPEIYLNVTCDNEGFKQLWLRSVSGEDIRWRGEEMPHWWWTDETLGDFLEELEWRVRENGGGDGNFNWERGDYIIKVVIGDIDDNGYINNMYDFAETVLTVCTFENWLSVDEISRIVLHTDFSAEEICKYGERFNADAILDLYNENIRAEIANEYNDRFGIFDIIELSGEGVSSAIANQFPSFYSSEEITYLIEEFYGELGNGFDINNIIGYIELLEVDLGEYLNEVAYLILELIDYNYSAEFLNDVINDEEGCWLDGRYNDINHVVVDLPYDMDNCDSADDLFGREDAMLNCLCN